MMIEMLIIAVIVFFVFIHNRWIDKDSIFGKNSKLIRMIKESDYDFLLIARYGDAVYDPNEVFMRRVKKGLKFGIVAFFIATFTGNVTFITALICVVVGYFGFKMDYMNLKTYYKSHLNQIDALLPYYLKGLEILIHHI